MDEQDIIMDSENDIDYRNAPPSNGRSMIEDRPRPLMGPPPPHDRPPHMGPPPPLGVYGGNPDGGC